MWAMKTGWIQMSRREMIAWAALIVLSTLLISGFVSVASQLEQRSWEAAQLWVDLARDDLAASLGIPADSIRVQSVEPVEFADGSLGASKPGGFG
jgi:hypothetical protein